MQHYLLQVQVQYAHHLLFIRVRVRGGKTTSSVAPCLFHNDSTWDPAHNAQHTKDIQSALILNFNKTVFKKNDHVSWVFLDACNKLSVPVMSTLYSFTVYVLVHISLYVRVQPSGMSVLYIALSTPLKCDTSEF